MFSHRHLHGLGGIVLPAFCRSLGAVLVASLAALPCQQAGGANNWQQPNRPKIEPPKPATGDGSIVGVQGNTITMTTATNQTMVVGITPMTSVRVTGAATKDAIKAGMCVEFVADVGEDHTAKEKIKRMAIFTPGPGRQKGLFPESAAFPQPPTLPGGKGKGPGAAMPGPDPGLFDAPAAVKGGHRLHGKKDDEGDLATEGPGNKLKPPGVFDVRGQVKSFHDGALTVMADRTAVKAELADDAQIELSLADCSIASRGDKIHVTGQSMPGRPGLIGAQVVEITLKEPYSGGRRHASIKGAKAEKAGAKSGPASKKGIAGEPADNEIPAAGPKKGAAKPDKTDGPAPKSKVKLGDDDY
ncbi:MAG: hypothetical protein ABR915_19195 [Thermoguttaceae bacterium]